MICQIKLYVVYNYFLDHAIKTSLLIAACISFAIVVIVVKCDMYKMKMPVVYFEDMVGNK